MRSHLPPLLLLCLLAACQSAPDDDTPPARTPGLNLQRAEDNLLALLKLRGATDGAETVFYWEGQVYAQVPDEAPLHLFRYKGYSIGRFEVADTGFQWLSREVGLYCDPQTGEVLRRWYNPWLRDSVDVVQVWNDPVNFRGTLGTYQLRPFVEAPGGTVLLGGDAILFYPSPLPASRYPQYARSDNYHAAEFTTLTCRRADLDDPQQSSVPATLSWSRSGEFLPWMKMGQRPGQLYLHCQGYKVPGGFAGLPEAVQRYVTAQQPAFAHAPDTYSEPNATPWTYFRQKLETEGSK
ncbi:MAG: DUF1838 domain-containing protein [Bacteroidia bacterium]